MARRQIELEVTFRAVVRGGDDYIPEDTAAEDSITLTMPTIDSKFVILPKIMEGVTLRVMQTLQGNVSSFYAKKAAEEKRKREHEQMKLRFPDGAPADDAEDGDDSDGEESPFDDDATDDTETEEDGEGDGGNLDRDQDDDVDSDDDTVELTPAGIDFVRIQQEAEARLRADGVDVQVTPVPATMTEGE